MPDKSKALRFLNIKANKALSADLAIEVRNKMLRRPPYD